MVVHDRSYARWDGDKDGRVPGARMILERGVRVSLGVLFKRKLIAQLLSFVAFGPFLFAVGALYLTFWAKANVEQFPDLYKGIADSGVLDVVSPNPETALFFLLWVQRFIVLVLCVMVGAGLIAEDRRTNALELYLSRPITVAHYVLGKVSVLGFFLSLVTIVPASLLVVLQMFLTGLQPEPLAELLDLLWRVVAAGAVCVAFLSLTVLAASALARRARNAAILWVGILVAVDGILAGILTDVFREPAVHLVSIGFNMGQVMAFILGSTENLDPDLSVAHSALILGGWALLSLVVVLRRTRPVEIVA